jgi:hypothetical protein
MLSTKRSAAQANAQVSPPERDIQQLHITSLLQQLPANACTGA